MQVGGIIDMSDTVRYVNSVLRGPIQSSITWSSCHLPSFGNQGEYAGYFDGPELDSVHDGPLVIIRPDMVYNGLHDIVDSWSTVRLVDFYGWEGDNNNGGPITWSLVYHEEQYAHLRIGHEDIFGRAGHPFDTGDFIRKSDIDTILSNAYAQWRALGGFHYDSRECHDNCHEECHGSGGWR